MYPQLVIFYSDNIHDCTACPAAAIAWKRIQTELQPLGVHLSSVNADKEQALATKLGIEGKTLPAVIGITEGHVRLFKSEQLTLHKVIEFVRKMISFGRPLVELSEDSYEKFLDGWRVDNRVRVMFITPDPRVRLRYWITAFKYREYAAFAHIHIDNGARHTSVHRKVEEVTNHSEPLARVSKDSSKRQENSHLNLNSPSQMSLLQRYSLTGSSRWMLIFSENSSWPEAMLSSSSEELRISLMWEMIEANRFLTLPRITSQV